jgi:glycine/D-amino acid oxidase-like deaminating enzyme
LVAREIRKRSDVVVVGAGIVGCAAAYHLARRGASVEVFDRGHVAGEQSGRAWGFVRQQSRHPAEIPLAIEASRIWGCLGRELESDVEFVRGGVLVPAESEEDEARLTEAARTARAHGIPTRIVDAEQIRQLAPGSALNWRMGLFSPEDGHAEPAAATQAFANAARRLGVIIHEETPVLGIETTNGEATGVVAGSRIVAAGAVLCAAGIGSADLVRTVGVSLPIQIVRASVAQTKAAQLTTQTAVWAPHVAFRPKSDGSYYVSNGYRGIDAEHDLTLGSARHLGYFMPTFLAHRRTLQLRLGREFLADLWRRRESSALFRAWPEPAINQRLVRDHERRFYEVFPHLAGLGLARAWAGRIDATPDLIPIIGAVDRPENLYIAAGFNGHGFALGPIVGKLLAELISEGRSSLSLHDFRLTRFAERKGHIGHNAL